MLQQPVADDYVIATGEEHSVREFVERCAPYFNMNIAWHGEGNNEVGIDTFTGKIVVRVDEKYFRPAEVDRLLGDPSKAKNTLGWAPKFSFDDLIKDMCENEKRF
jgi:GDPmannose 4,6-dehydratase